MKRFLSSVNFGSRRCFFTLPGGQKFRSPVIKDHVHDHVKYDRPDDVHDRMLFQENGRKTDQDRKNDAADLELDLSAHRFVPEQGNTADQRVVNVDTRENIGRGIDVMKLEHCPGKEIPVFVDIYAQVDSVMKEGTDRQTDRHPDIQKGDKAIEFLFIVEEIIQPGHNDIDEPKKIRDNEVLAEGDLPVEIRRHIMEGRNMPFQPEKPGQIERQI